MPLSHTIATDRLKGQPLEQSVRPGIARENGPKKKGPEAWMKKDLKKQKKGEKKQCQYIL